MYIGNIGIDVSSSVHVIIILNLFMTLIIRDSLLLTVSFRPTLLFGLNYLYIK